MMDPRDDIALRCQVFGQPGHHRGRIAVAVAEDHQRMAAADRRGAEHRQSGLGESDRRARRFAEQRAVIGHGPGPARYRRRIPDVDDQLAVMKRDGGLWIARFEHRLVAVDQGQGTKSDTARPHRRELRGVGSDHTGRLDECLCLGEGRASNREQRQEAEGNPHCVRPLFNRGRRRSCRRSKSRGRRGGARPRATTPAARYRGPCEPGPRQCPNG